MTEIVISISHRLYNSKNDNNFVEMISFEFSRDLKLNKMQ